MHLNKHSSYGLILSKAKRYELLCNNSCFVTYYYLIMEESFNSFQSWKNSNILSLKKISDAFWHNRITLSLSQSDRFGITLYYILCPSHSRGSRKSPSEKLKIPTVLCSVFTESFIYISKGNTYITSKMFKILQKINSFCF